MEIVINVHIFTASFSSTLKAAIISQAQDIINNPRPPLNLPPTWAWMVSFVFFEH